MDKTTRKGENGGSDQRVCYHKPSPEFMSHDTGTSAPGTIDRPGLDANIRRLVQFIARLAAEADYKELLRALNQTDCKDQRQEKD